jgi:hypothetical protein
MAEADKPSLSSTACSGRTYDAERRAAPSFRAPARVAASHAGLGLWLCHETHECDMRARGDGKGRSGPENGRGQQCC